MSTVRPREPSQLSDILQTPGHSARTQTVKNTPSRSPEVALKEQHVLENQPSPYPLLLYDDDFGSPVSQSDIVMDLSHDGEAKQDEVDVANPCITLRN